MTVSDEELCAFADGALDPIASQRVASAVAADATLAERVARMRRQSEALRSAFRDVASQPVPHRLSDLARHGPRSNAIGISDWRRISALAAAVALVALGLSWFARPAPGLYIARANELHAASALATALDAQLSGERSPQGITIAFSMPAEGSSYCRAYLVELTPGENTAGASAGLACRSAGAWHVVALTESAATPAERGYNQAAGEIPQLVIEAAQARRAGDPLDTSAERAAIARQWRMGSH